MNLLAKLLDVAGAAKGRLEMARLQRRWAKLRSLGMHIGDDVLLPASTFIDTSHCFLISIGDHCGFGPDCLILAHDAQMDEFLDAARLGTVLIHDSCHIGARTVILPGVEIGPRTIVGASSVVAKSLPPETVCAGNPAAVVCSLGEYLERQRQRMAERPKFAYMEYDVRFLNEERKRRLINAVSEGGAYMVGGRSAELRGEGGTFRTAGTQGRATGM